MAYKAVTAFKDLQTGFYYNKGDTYPASGEVDKARVNQLINPTSQRGALIEEVTEVEVVSAPVVKKKSKKSEEKKED